MCITSVKIYIHPCIHIVCVCVYYVLWVFFRKKCVKICVPVNEIISCAKTCVCIVVYVEVRSFINITQIWFFLACVFLCGRLLSLLLKFLCWSCYLCLHQNHEPVFRRTSFFLRLFSLFEIGPTQPQLFVSPQSQQCCNIP